jgi:hypothetical protein
MMVNAPPVLLHGLFGAMRAPPLDATSWQPLFVSAQAATYPPMDR